MTMTKERHPFHEWIQLEQPRLGTVVTYATDEFFAAKERLIESADPVFVDDKYDDHGKWMDGWESRRKRTPGNDHCIIRLGVPGIVHGVDIDTSYFTGNYPGPNSRVTNTTSWRSKVTVSGRICGSIYFRTVASRDCESMVKCGPTPRSSTV